MRIDLLSANDPRTTVTTPMRAMWRVGAIIEAVAIRDAVTGQLWLQLNNQSLAARLASGHSAGPLNGEHLKLRVLRDTPVLALESVEDPAADRTTDDSLRRYLPRQTSPAPLLANLGWLVRNPDHIQGLPVAIRQALTHVWNSLPTASNLQDPQALAQALLHSGTFLEAQLAKHWDGQSRQLAGALSQDFKAALLALREQLRNLRLMPSSNRQPPGPMPALHAPLSAIATGPASLSVLDEASKQLSELQQQTEGSLARVTTNQLLNDQAAGQGLLSWLIELPIKHEDRAELLRFKFEREAKQHLGNAEGWTVEVAIDLGNQGALHVQISLVNKRFNVQLRSDSPGLITALSQQLPLLKSSLQEQGLELDRVVCLHGGPVDNAGARLTRLLDIHA